MKAQLLLLGALGGGGGGLGVKMSSSCGLVCTYDTFVQSLSPPPSLDVIYSRELLTLCPLQGGFMLFALQHMCKVGWGAGPSMNRS